MEKDIANNRIRELREDRDLRQIDVANAVGIDQRSLSNYETGKTNPDSYAIIKLSQYFGVTCDYLLGVSERNINGKNVIIDELEDIRKRLLEIEKHIG